MGIYIVLFFIGMSHDSVESGSSGLKSNRGTWGLQEMSTKMDQGFNGGETRKGHKDFSEDLYVTSLLSYWSSILEEQRNNNTKVGDLEVTRR